MPAQRDALEIEAVAKWQVVSRVCSIVLKRQRDWGRPFYMSNGHNISGFKKNRTGHVTLKPKVKILSLFQVN